MVWYIVVLPFLAFLTSSLIAIYSYKNSSNSSFLNFIAWLSTTIPIALSSLLSFLLLINLIKLEETKVYERLFNWFVSGNLLVEFSIYLDSFVAIMVFVVLFISFLVHFYSYFYISKKDNLARFQAYLSLFTFSMLVLVTSSNLVQMFIGWELISLSSYLLIAFWYKENSAKKASSKAFFINRFADIGYLLGTFGFFAIFGSFNFTDIQGINDSIRWSSFNVFNFEIYYIDFIAVTFLLAAFAKSAQIGLHIWLPDAMEAPTPVSALLHAATMVTAGVFLVIKLSPIYEISLVAKNIMLLFATISVFYGALVACMQVDIKKIIAYSTMSQLGYMFLALGIGAYSGAFFHLVTHAFFKALLFLGAGSVIHGMNGEQNIKKMGNIWRKMPITYITMIIGFLALIGVPGFSGFYSKEAILNYLYNETYSSIYVKLAFYSAIVSIFFTSFYSLRLIINVFHSNEKYDISKTNVHESSVGILVVLIILSILSVISGGFLFDSFVGNLSSVLFRDLYFSVKAINKEHLEHTIEYASLAMILLSLLISYIIYIREKSFSEKLKATFPMTYNLVVNKFYFDEVYESIIVKPSLMISKSLNFFDDRLYDKYGINSFASFIFRISRVFSKLQNGFVNFYAVVMLLGLLLILTYCFFIMGIK